MAEQIRAYSLDRILGVQKDAYATADFNNIVLAGRYIATPEAINIPTSSWGYVEVLGNGYDVGQLYYSLSGNLAIYYRAKMASKDWTSWKQINFVS